VLAEVVMLADVRRDGWGRRSEQHAAEGQTRNVFEHVGVFDGFGCGPAPGEGRVAGDKDAGNGDGVEILCAEAADDDRAGVADVAGGDLVGGQRFGDGNGAVEVVGVGGTEAGNGAASLSPGRSEFRVGVDDSADLGEFAVEQGVGVEIAGGAELAFDDFAVEVGDDEVLGRHGGVVDAAGLDDDEGLGAGAVDAAGVAEGVGSEAAAGDFLVGVEDLLAQFGQ